MGVDARYYTKTEETLNVATHGFGLLMSVVALVVLVVKASLNGDALDIVSVAIYGASLVVLYFASTAFHLVRNQKTRNKLNIFDHASIYLLIAGSYTPIVLITLRGPWGWSMFGVVWGLAVAGVILKIFFTGRFNFISTILYLMMGWVIIIAISPLVKAFSFEGLMWLFSGGMFYTIGSIFFLINKIPYNHAVFHVFVLAGSICHFIAVFWFVLPS